MCAEVLNYISDFVEFTAQFESFSENITFKLKYCN